MTSEDFRTDIDRVKSLREALSNATLQEALLIIHDSSVITDAADDSDPLSSVRKLSNLAGRADVIRELYTLATPLSETKPPPMPTFGVTDPPPEGWDPSKI
jgi:hypothetical protein